MGVPRLALGLTLSLNLALGRPDIWPAADLGLQLAVAECLGLPERPREKDLREIGER